MKPNKIDAGTRIHSIRISHNLTMQEFGSLIEDSPKTTVNNWEKGKALPTKTKLEKIALLGKTTSNWIKYGSLEDYVIQLLNEKVDLDSYPKEKIINETLKKISDKNLTYNDDIKILSIANNILNSYSQKHFFTPEQITAQNILDKIFSEKVESDYLFTNFNTVSTNIYKDSLVGIDGLFNNPLNADKLILYLETIYLLKCLVNEKIPLNIDKQDIDKFLLSLNDNSLLQYDKSRNDKWTNYLLDSDDIDKSTLKESIINKIINKINQL